MCFESTIYEIFESPHSWYLDQIIKWAQKGPKYILFTPLKSFEFMKNSARYSLEVNFHYKQKNQAYSEGN